MKTSLPETRLEAINESLRLSNTGFMHEYPGETGRRQPVHTVYGGAHLFKSDSAPRLGRVAERAMAEPGQPHERRDLAGHEPRGRRLQRRHRIVVGGGRRAPWPPRR